ncbi:MAG: homoserine kinase [Hyphomicrobiaceae bacterium]
MAVYTEVSDDELADFIAGYDIGTLVSYKGIAEGVENSNYLVVTTLGQFILTLYEKRVDPAELPFFIGLMGHLAGRGLSCPTPLVTRDGQHLRRLAGRPAAMVTFLEGVWVRHPKPHHCEAVGTALAHLHRAGEGFPIHRPNALGLGGWRPLFARFADAADDVQRGLRQTIALELDALEAAWPQGLPEGVIHADLFPDNVFFLNDTLSGLIDFYFACNDALAYDIAVSLNAWCFEPDLSFNITKAQAMLAGYQRVRPLSGAERAALPLLCRGSALRFLLTRAYDWLNTPKDAFVKPHDPAPFLRRLRFHQRVASAAEYGLPEAVAAR